MTKKNITTEYTQTTYEGSQSWLSKLIQKNEWSFIMALITFASMVVGLLIITNMAPLAKDISNLTVRVQADETRVDTGFEHVRTSLDEIKEGQEEMKRDIKELLKK